MSETVNASSKVRISSTGVNGSGWAKNEILVFEGQCGGDFHTRLSVRNNGNSGVSVFSSRILL